MKTQLAYVIGKEYESSADKDIRLLTVRIFEVVKKSAMETLARNAMSYGPEEVEKAKELVRTLRKEFQREHYWERSSILGGDLNLCIQGSFEKLNWYSVVMERVELSQESLSMIKKLLGKEREVKSLNQLLQRLREVKAVEVSYETLGSYSEYVECLEPSQNLIHATRTTTSSVEVA